MLMPLPLNLTFYIFYMKSSMTVLDRIKEYVFSVCVCVCMYVYMYVCVCVCVHISGGGCGVSRTVYL